MTASEYKAAREKVGTQQAVADALGVHQVTVARRETGDMKITTEAAFAMLWLVRGGGAEHGETARERHEGETQNARAYAALLRPLVRHARRAVGGVAAWREQHGAAHAGDDVRSLARSEA